MQHKPRQRFSQIPNSQTSQERVEHELTQEARSDVDMDQDAQEAFITEPAINKFSETGEFTAPTSTSDSRFNGSQRLVDSQSLGPEGQGHADMEVDAELEWPEDMEIPKSSVPTTDNSRLSPLLAQGDSQPPQNSSQAPSSPDRTHSQNQSQSQTRLRSRRSFRSGSFQVIPGSKPSRHGSFTSQSIGIDRSASGNVGGNRERVASADMSLSMEADVLISQDITDSQQAQWQESQESLSESDGGGGYRHSYDQLQTQAPYQSQSYSQSLSETSAGCIL